MNRAKLSVTNLLTVYQIRSRQTVPQFDLFGVDLRILIPAEREFPVMLPQVDVFARFFAATAGRARLRFRLQWRSGVHPRQAESAYQFARQFDLPRAYQDEWFRLHHPCFPGEGWYHLTLWQRVSKNWKERSWKRLATTPLYVEKRT